MLSFQSAIRQTAQFSIKKTDQFYLNPGFGCAEVYKELNQGTSHGKKSPFHIKDAVCLLDFRP